MEFAQVHVPRHVCQLRLFQMALVQKSDGPLDALVIVRVFDCRITRQRTNFYIHEKNITRSPRHSHPIVAEFCYGLREGQLGNGRALPAKP
jgi:hypothetical protein